MTEAKTQSAPSLRKQRVILPLVPTREMCAAVQREGYRISSAELRRIFEIMSIWAPAPPTTLTEAVAAARAEGWQPIETAPKDGTTVVDLFNGYRHTGLYWDADQRGGGGWSDAQDRWRHRDDRRGVYGATHWMLAPSDPTGLPVRLSTIPCTGVDGGPLADFAPPTTPGGRTDG